MSAADPRQRLLDLSVDRRVSLAQLSGLISKNSAYLHQFVRKGSPRRLEEGDRRTLAHFLGVAESELRGASDISYAGQQDWADISRLPIGASAGPGLHIGGAGAELPFGVLRFARAWLRAQGFDPAMLSALAVEGDSMQPILHDGDEILVDRTPRPPRDGIHVVRGGEALLVKRLDFARPGVVTLRSENPAYPPVDLPRAEVEVIGRVVWKSGRL